MKTPEETAEEYVDQDKVASAAINRDAEDLVKDAFIAGYNACRNHIHLHWKEEWKDLYKRIEESCLPAMDAMEGRYLRQVKELETAIPQWISVKDRLPEINQQFIAFVENKEVCNCCRYQNRSSDSSPSFYASTKTGLLICGLESISHWMLLPEPPKEDK